jgi:hypothetical protein
MAPHDDHGPGYEAHHALSTPDNDVVARHDEARAAS